MQQNLPGRTDKEDHEKDNPALSKVIERNIRPKAERERSLQGRLADAITSFSGRIIFAYVHVIWFGIWILLNTGRFGVHAFDPFPYGLLTMVVFLEAGAIGYLLKDVSVDDLAQAIRAAHGQPLQDQIACQQYPVQTRGRQPDRSRYPGAA